jgi:hypothetical protein
MNFIQVQHFIMTNIIQHALKHSLHQHPRQYVGDTICFFLVRVPRAILHHEVPLIGQTHPFCVFWFEDSDQDWQDFCVRNVLSSNIRFVHTYDRVIGPVCLPHDTDHVFEIMQAHILRTYGQKSWHKANPSSSSNLEKHLHLDFKFLISHRISLQHPSHYEQPKDGELSTRA